MEERHGHQCQRRPSQVPSDYYYDFKGGSIINIGSISSAVADRIMALYIASKAFLHGRNILIFLNHDPSL